MTSPSPRPSSLTISRPVVLIGLMGAGKTTVGRRLAELLALPFKDADEEIEDAANMSVADIFETYGEGYFREGERKVIERLLSEGPMVLATGGGAFMNAATRELVKLKAISIWLRADLDLLVKRTAQKATRPLLQQGDAREILARLLKERAPVYAEADIVVDSLEGPHLKTVNRIIKALDRHAEGGATL
ncbi:putative shikimate kinase [Parvularcula bermudensis HTCC2503]|uniref:Shikimate kinase n=1 Tax=Parvularcula bermudensis (strain ATCC BAA-594 / HTCC2503 / KCTC 12087) TaxID=314260 RepID=E0TB43_PARBH|nr:shikimate kinase [Parvularcula bermudensis]ADM08252.1 putative shikimate kinase [Parvularcula bermudensis HTCC2503]